jgi:prepilin-type N-terminal cleavage/methylation domain-containing protein
MKLKGFSLIEIILGLALFSMVMSSSMVVMYSSLRSSRKAAAIAMAKAEGAYTLGAMEYMIRFAKNVVCNTGNSLTVTRLNSTTPIVYTFSGSQIASNGAALTSNNVRVSSCGPTFTCSPVNEGKMVEICFQIDNAGGIDVTDRAGALGGNGIRFHSWVTSRNQFN